MANYEVISQEVVDQWGDGEGRAEVQAVHETEIDNYAIRVCYYQDNGRFGQSAPTISPDKEIAEKTADAVLNMAEEARQAQREARLSELDDLVRDVGYERTKELLSQEANKEN